MFHVCFSHCEEARTEFCHHTRGISDLKRTTQHPSVVKLREKLSVVGKYIRSEARRSDLRSDSTTTTFR